MSQHEVILARHGQTEWSKSGQHTGRTDIPLTTRGEHQADVLAPMLAAREFAEVWTSPLGRAVETARRAGYPDAKRDPELQEWDYGAYEGRTTAEVRTEIPNWSVWTDPMIDGESLVQVGARADRVIDRVLAVDGEVALFAHGHFLRILTARWLALPPVDGRLFALETATVSVLGYEHETRVIRAWNDRAPLRAEEAGVG